MKTTPLLGTYFRNTVIVVLQISITFAVQKPIASRHSEKLFSLYCAMYSWITSIKSPLFGMTNFSASLTNILLFLLKSHNGCCYVNGPILAPPPFCLQKHTDLRAHDFAHAPDLCQ